MGIFSKKKNENNNEQPSSKKAKTKLYLEYEDEENSNPKIKLYNEFVRHAFAYNTEPFSSCGVSSQQEIRRIYEYVVNDYPELFWVSGYVTIGQPIGNNELLVDKVQIAYRCVTQDGQIDVKDIERKKSELKKAAKYFTRGITKKTKPYDALITIYRRLILELDYDGVGLQTEESRGDYEDLTTDDNLRSLYSALVHKKVVCAGYAVAMQYLLQSVGITCACVTSESHDGSCHAFNALKIGKYVYYLDATWGDTSNTLTGKSNAGDISYDYCCVPYKEFLLTGNDSQAYHTPRRSLYPNLEEFKDTNHEYFRFRKSYLTRYDENLIANVFAKTAMSYNPKEMGNFAVPFRCHDKALMTYVANQLSNKANMSKILAKAKAMCKNRKTIKLLSGACATYTNPSTATIYVRFD
ncbi:MAG: hypothetical protein E7358_04960 [Clostridiales bacterium]|nr:hypothetical protein [Clostridiales bacterium]